MSGTTLLSLTDIRFFTEILTRLLNFPHFLFVFRKSSVFFFLQITNELTKCSVKTL